MTLPASVYFALQNRPLRTPMPRKKRSTAETPDTRDRILDAALALFNADGSHAVSTRHIAARLEISPGNLYYHFANKEEIVLCLYERIEAATRGHPRAARRQAAVVRGGAAATSTTSSATCGRSAFSIAT